MPDNHPSTTRDTNTIDPRYRRFESAWRSWRSGEPTPRWQDHLPPSEEPCSRELIVLLLRIDMEHRIRAGLPALLHERYFEHPRLQQDDARLDAGQQVELIRWEYRQRWQNGERARRGEYESAFPQHAAALGDLNPHSNCPRCQRTIALQETDDTLHCPHCDIDSPLPTVSPLLVAALVMPDADAPGLDLRDYELSDRLGLGGMGEVYRANDPALGRDLAIKVMKEKYREAPLAEQRFLREARITGSLQHPGIVPIYNLGRLADGRLHYTMRLVRGRTLADIFHEEAGRGERVPFLLAIFEKVCQAMAYAHSRRVIHRDLKPSNVMVGAFGEVQVMDWGLAKPLAAVGQAFQPDAAEASTDGTEAVDASPELTRPGSGMGTPAYMPPEQAAGAWDSVDERADVFALGAILCEILTGNPPYRSRDIGAVLEQAKRGDVAGAWERLERTDADAQLTALCRECLTPQRDDRPRDAGAVANRLADYQAQVQERLRRAELDKARAEVAAREGRKRLRWVRAFVLVLLLGLAVSSGLAVWAWFAQGKARDSEARALVDRDEKQQALHLSQTRLGQIEKGNEVLASIFRGLNPYAEAKGGPSLREQLVQHLQEAAGRLNEEAIGDPLTVADLQSNLGVSLVDLGQARQAIEPLRKARQIRLEKLGPSDRKTLTITSNLAYAYLASEQFDRAVPLYEEVLEKAKVHLGAADADTLASMGNLAAAYRAIGRMDKALPLLEQELAVQTKTLGPDHEDTLFSMNNVGAAYVAVGRSDKAVPLLLRTREKMAAKFGPDHPITLTGMHNLADAYLAAKQPDKAVSLYEPTLIGRKAKLGIDHPDTLKTMTYLAVAYQTAGQLDRAEKLLRELLAVSQKKDGPQSLAAAGALSQLGGNLLLQKKYTEAEPPLRQCLAIREKNLPDNWLTFNARSLLGDTLLGQKRYTEAEPLLVQGYEGMQKQADKIPPPAKIRLVEALTRLVRLNEATGKKEEAERWRQKLEQAKAAQQKTKP